MNFGIQLTSIVSEEEKQQIEKCYQLQEDKQHHYQRAILDTEDG